MWLQRRRLRAIPTPSPNGRSSTSGIAGVRRTALMIVALTAVNIVIILLAGYGAPALDGIAGILRPGVPHADAPAVHRVAAAPHARVACVACHIGEGAKAFVHAKLAGTRQL